MLKKNNHSRLDLTMLALADETRRAILRRLSEGEARVTELAQPFAISLNAVSKHIRLLERAGLVRRRCVGREHFLSFNQEPLDEAVAWMKAQGEYRAADFDIVRSAVSRANAFAADFPQDNERDFDVIL
jgi:DNA-binding transcriptional ArsR family regulator